MCPSYIAGVGTKTSHNIYIYKYFGKFEKNRKLLTELDVIILLLARKKRLFLQPQKAFTQDLFPFLKELPSQCRSFVYKIRQSTKTRYCISVGSDA